MQRLQAVSGMIQTELWNEDVEVKNVSGEVTVRGHNGKGTLRATTVSGDLRLEDIGPEMELNTVTGDMHVRVAELSKARIKTTNGDLELRAASLTDDVRIEAEGDQRRPALPLPRRAGRRVRHRDLQRRNRQLLRAQAAPHAANTARATRCASRKATATAASGSRR